MTTGELEKKMLKQHDLEDAEKHVPNGKAPHYSRVLVLPLGSGEKIYENEHYIVYRSNVALQEPNIHWPSTNITRYVIVDKEGQDKPRESFVIGKSKEETDVAD